MIRILLFLSLLHTLPARAEGIAVVDFQRASQTVREGTQIQDQLRSIQESQQAKIKDMEMQLNTLTKN